MRPADIRKWVQKVTACALAFAVSVGLGAPARAGDDNDSHAIKTATPIKHVIIIVGENRSFDHLFATYVPKRKGEKVLNLLSEGIIEADGTPGPHFAKAHQFQIVSAPNGGKFFSSAEMANKQLYVSLPPPDVNGVEDPPAAPLLSLGGDPGLPPQDQFLLGTGGTGLPFTEGPDTRVPMVSDLRPGPLPIDRPEVAVRHLHRRHRSSVLPNGPTG
jgi:phospholipase C